MCFLLFVYASQPLFCRAKVLIPKLYFECMQTFIRIAVPNRTANGVTRNGIIGDTEPILRMSYRRRMERIEATIDLHGATAHIFRHNYFTYAASLGTDLKTLQSISPDMRISRPP